MQSLRFTQKKIFKTSVDTSTFYTLATFPRDVSDDDDDDDDDKAVTANQFCNLKWKDVTMECGRWNSNIGRLKVIGSVSEKIRVSGLNT